MCNTTRKLSELQKAVITLLNFNTAENATAILGDSVNNYNVTETA